jgi:hypothetical protein
VELIIGKLPDSELGVALELGKLVFDGVENGR